GFESFVEEDRTVKAYIQEKEFDAQKLTAVLANFKEDKVHFSYGKTVILGQNWNEIWEQEFPPVLLENLSIVAPFHSADFRIGRVIEIDPKMSFGTGHHATTSLMCQAMDTLEFKHTKVLDMGTGTGVLAIFAEMLGAQKVVGVDIETWAVENAKENVLRNNCRNIDVLLGDIDGVTEGGYQVILANINKNVLTRHLSHYQSLLSDDGVLLLSGFFTFDNDEIVHKADSCGFQLQKAYEKENWSCLQFLKV
ncbi:MAG: 50S ribosomal protein L11 methyltransferase, partial [Bacteroidota bacterium]